MLASTMSHYLDRRRAAAAAAWDLRNEIVLVGAGDFVPLPGGADQTYPFRPHSEYFYLADRSRPCSVLAFDPQEGWFDFVPRVSEEEKVWVGDVPDEGLDLAGFAGWLAARQGRPVAVLGSDVPGVQSDGALRDRLRELLFQVRRPKDEVELERMRRAAAATVAGFAILPDLLRPGLSERQVQIELEAEFFRHGASRTAYDTIVGSGPNAAVFHFAPSARRLAAGELVLVDAGGEVEGYACDVTRTYPAAGTFSPAQRDLYAVVLAAEKAAIGKCRAGKEYREIHLEAAVDMTRGLVDLGYLVGDPESLVEQDVHALFFPHGVGHMVGLGVRDASGYLPGRERSKRPGLCYLRIDLPLAPGFAVTIEPGLYFSPALLNDPERRSTYRQQVRWDRVEPLIGQGGIRIEDNLVITEGEPENLTVAIPKEL